jgi:putative N-acetylmannosamine-6-phosphate epimerase
MFFKLDGENLPLVSTGTSPFIGAGQFGLMASIYRMKFMRNTDTMVEILEAAYQSGARGVEIIPMGNICEAAKIMKDTYDDYIIMGSTFPGPDPLIEDMIKIETKLIFVHAIVSDRLNKHLNNLLDEISSRGIIPGIAVHNPINTLEYAFLNLKHINVFLIPFNASGFIMGNQKRLENLIDSKKDTYFIGMKTLAAGRLSPSKAFDYISKHNICSVTIGMVNPREAKESTKIALDKLIHRKMI